VEPKPRARNQLLIELSVSEYSQNMATPSLPLLHMPNTSLSPREPFSFYQVINLRGSSGTLSITWTPGASPRSGRKAGGPRTRVKP
jgi:hypothetical protein